MLKTAHESATLNCGPLPEINGAITNNISKIQTNSSPAEGIISQSAKKTKARASQKKDKTKKICVFCGKTMK